MAGELKHNTVGTELTQAEFEAAALHGVDGWVAGDILYVDATGKLVKLAAGALGYPLVSGGPGVPPGWSRLPPSGLLVPNPGLNLLVNPGFEVWQRGIGPFTANNVYTADMWLTNLITSTMSLTRITSTIGTQGYSAQVTYTHVATGYLILTQPIESPINYRGQTLTASITVKSSVDHTVYLMLYDSAGSNNSPYNVGTTEQVLTATRTVNAAATYLRFAIYILGVSCVVELNDAVLVGGSSPSVYGPIHPVEDLARCQRYYEVHGGVNAAFPGAYGTATAASQIFNAHISFAVTKAATPTVTKNGTWNVVNCAQPTVDYASPSGYRLSIASTAAGATAAYPNSSDDTVTAEASIL